MKHLEETKKWENQNKRDDLKMVMLSCYKEKNRWTKLKMSLAKKGKPRLNTPEETKQKMRKKKEVKRLICCRRLQMKQNKNELAKNKDSMVNLHRVLKI